MVIGGEKRAQIQREKLLHCYFKLFEDVLFRRNRHLLVIGYGFRDSHINEVIAHAIRKCGLKLYVISPASPRDFRATLLGVHNEDKKTLEHRKALEDKQTLWEGLAGYWDWELKDVCPVTENYFSEDIRRAIFQY
jgi:hypothetical protein